MALKHYPEEFKTDAVALFLSDPSNTYKRIAADLGISRGTLRNWVLEAQRRGTAPARPAPAQPPAQRDLSSPDVHEQENQQLRARIRELETERDILRKAAKYFAGGDALVNRFQFVADHQAAYGVKRLCRVLEIARSSYYRWRSATQARAARARADAQLADRIATIHAAHDGTYGSPRITAELRDQGVQVNHKRVERVMRQHGIAGLRLRRKVRTTVPAPDAAPVPDLLRRDFTAPAPGRRYVGDITYLPIADGTFLFLATVLDLGSRRLVGWSIANHMRTSLVIDALDAAAATRGGTLDGAIFHSDNGAQYCAADFTAACNRLGVTRSRGAVGTSADNAAAESLNATLKRETLQGARHWPTTHTARQAVFRWATRYNTRRRHSRLGQLSPINYEKPPVA
ncbi:IS3 family transposase [Actinomadura rubrisoli]|uniref:IS3 family transposase n=1 Tax=Actinomadura rubrisoli TaxID=2530368 RepID=A0A4R4ZJ37_9ACTN|nr:IS3 family transposase [Actinomadura rubrisoli]TDD58748.1 IS3 family transposase [Actinomadura rubrisoli]